MDQPVDGALQFLLTVGQCKETPRQGWVENDITAPESVGDHMYRMAVLCMMSPAAASGMDRDRLIRLALCHDMAEAVVGDITPSMKVPKEVKHAAEAKAMGEMAALVPKCHGAEMEALFHEYEAQETQEAKFLRDMDLLEMVLQAYRYEVAQGAALDGFFPCVAKLRHPWAKAIGDRVMALRAGGAAEQVHPLPADKPASVAVPVKKRDRTQ
jgi:putative hydrolase of HD superfamily